MAKTIKEERLRWIKPIAERRIRLVDVAEICPYGKRSLERWLAAYRKGGEDALEPKSTRPKTNPKETPIRIKERIVELRKETKKCSLKLKWSLEKEGIFVHKNTIQKIIKTEGLTRRYRIRAVKTDNGSNFTNRYTGYLKSSDPMNPRMHDFDLLCQKYNIIHYLIDPGKPVQNGKVERSHREDQEKFYKQNRFKSFKDLQNKLVQWNIYYNNLEHCGLNGKTPNEFLSNYQLTNPPNVCG